MFQIRHLCCYVSMNFNQAFRVHQKIKLTSQSRIRGGGPRIEWELQVLATNRYFSVFNNYHCHLETQKSNYFADSGVRREVVPGT